MKLCMATVGAHSLAGMLRGLLAQAPPGTALACGYGGCASINATLRLSVQTVSRHGTDTLSPELAEVVAATQALLDAGNNIGFRSLAKDEQPGPIHMRIVGALDALESQSTTAHRIAA